MLRLLCLCAWALAAIAQIQELQRLEPVQPTAPGKGAIEGTVSDSASHEPVRKAQVTLSGVISPQLTVVTDASGRFLFRDLPAGSYWLNTSKPGYNPQQTFSGTESSVGVMLGDSEQKKGVEIGLTHGGSIGGRVANEDDVGVRGCTVSVVQSVYEQNRRTLRGVNGASTNEKGEYRIHDLAPGRYQVFVQCQASLPAAHPLIPRGDPRTPHDAYLSQFYGGKMDPSTASRLTLAAGASLDGVDFQMTRRAALILRGGVSSADPEAVAGGVNLLLLPANRLMRGLLQWGAQANVQDRTFEIGPLMPGPYVLYAYNNREGRIFAAQRTIELGTVSPDPVEMQLTSSAELKGSVQFDSDDHPPESGQIMMAPVDRPFFMQQPQGQIDKEGGFMLTGVLPGRWRLMVNIAGYVKSVSLGGLQASPYLLDIPAGASGPLRIVVGTKMATVSVKIADAPADRQTAALIFPEDSERLGAGLERTGTTLGAAPLEFAGLPPGRYRVFATDSQNPWALVQRPDLLKALESRTAVVEVKEGGRASTTVEIVPREDLARLLEEKE